MATYSMHTPPMPPERAKRIIKSLRNGTPPEKEVGLFSVGRQPLLEYFESKLSEIRDFGLADVKFISADFGHGKTHFLDLVRLKALDLGFVVSKVELHSTEVPFDRLEMVIRRLVDDVSTREFQKNGFEKVLQKWARGQAGKQQWEIHQQLNDLPLPPLRQKLVEYAVAYAGSPTPQYDRCIELLRWFRGEVTGVNAITNIKAYLHGLTEFFRLAGHAGLVVMLDEAEAITSLSRVARRDLANENIRQIIDNDRDTASFYFIFASTPTFFSPDENRGASTYDALWRRIRNPIHQANLRNLDRVIVELPKLTEEEFLCLSRNIKDIYEIAESQVEAVTDEHLRVLASYVIRRTDARVGTLVRSTVGLLDEARAEEFNFSGAYEYLVEQVIQAEQRERAR